MMNRFLKTVYTLLLTVVVLSASAQDKRFATIKGHFVGEDVAKKEVRLFKTVLGDKVEVARTDVAENGDFSLMYPVEEAGFFLINVNEKPSGKRVLQEHDLKRFYFEGGVEVDINLRVDGYELVKTNSEKNRLLSEWNCMIDTAYTHSHGFMYARTTYLDYFPLLPGYVKMMEDFKANINTGDANFDELMKLLVETDMICSAIRMVRTPRTKHPTEADFPAYYDEIIKEKSPTSIRLLELPYGLGFVADYVYMTMKFKDKPKEITENILLSMEEIANDQLKAYYVLGQLSGIKTYDETYLRFKEKVEPYFTTDYLKEQLNQFEISIRTFSKGSPAYDFKGVDVNGKEHRLSDYKGTVVYVDVWATWCGPCKAEIPKLKALEEKMHGEPITFLSISIDKVKDQKKWASFVKANDLKGVQLMADKAFDSDLVKAYGITGIPRFMIFDKEGKVVTIDAPRPSHGMTENFLRNLAK